MSVALIVIVSVGCFVTIFAGIGIFMLVKYFQDKKKSEESQAWSATTGEITESFVRESHSQDSDGMATTSYYAEVRYLYQVMGIEYNGDKISFGGNIGGSRKKAGETAAQYPVGKNVSVYYDPDNHEDAVLERRMGGKSIGVVFTLVGLCSACVGLIAGLVMAFGN